jgi:hypothetical protein
MAVRAREPLSLQERHHLRFSALWAAACLAIAAVYLLAVVVNGVVDSAALLGVRRHDVWVFLSEMLPVPLFLGCQGCWGASLAYGIKLLGKRPVCLVWMAVPPAGLVALAGALVGYFLVTGR